MEIKIEEEFSDMSDGSFEVTTPPVRSRKLHKNWTRDEEFVLVRLVEQYEILWNWSLASYKNQMRKNKAWKEISKDTNHIVIDCRNHWNTIRSRFNVERKNILLSKNRAGVPTYEPRYELYPSLQFLLRAGPKPISDKQLLKNCGIIEAEHFEMRDSISSCSTPNTLDSSPAHFNLDSYEVIASSASRKHKSAPQNLRSPPEANIMPEVAEKNRWKKVFSEFIYYELDRYTDHDAQILKNQILMVCMNFQPKQSNSPTMDVQAVVLDSNGIKEELYD